VVIADQSVALRELNVDASEPKVLGDKFAPFFG